VNQLPIDLPEQVLLMIVSRVRDVRPAAAEADARSLYADVMHGIGSVSRLWRRLTKGMLMGDELAWLRVPGAAAAAECMASFPRALSLRIDGGARAADIGAVLGSRSVMRLEIAHNPLMRGCEGLGQLVGLRALYIAACGQLRDVAALSSLVDLRTLHVTCCKLYMPRAGSLAPSLALMPQLTSLNLAGNFIGDAGAASLAPILARMAQLTSIDLSCNAIGDAGAASLAPSLARMAQLTSLDLGGNGIGAAGAASLAPSLARMAQLASLDLSRNDIGDAGAASLAPSLALMPQLASLYLGDNYIGDAGAASLAPSLARLTRLTSLDLS
jgi:hypothetical protein